VSLGRLATFGCGRCDAGRRRKIGGIIEVSRTDAAAAAIQLVRFESE
jgi:hypothetical protein